MRIERLFNNKVMIAAVALSLAIVGAGAGTTIAYVSSETQTVTNTFETGSIETKIVEVVSDFTKEPYVVNVGENDCYIRMRADVSPSTAGSLESLVKGLDKTNWVYNEKDGFFYYQKAVAPNEMTATPLFKEIKNDAATLAKIEEGFDIVLYQEAVQTVVYTESKTYSNMAEIWEYYDTVGKK